MPRDQQPPVAVVFWAFRIMVLLGFLMVGLGLWSLYTRWRRHLYESTALHRFALAMSPAGLIAVIAGWVTTEVGRQPYTVYGLLRTADSASPLEAGEVGTSLIAFILVYFAIFGAGTFYILRQMGRLPRPETVAEPERPIRTGGITPPPVAPSLVGGSHPKD